MMKKSPWKERFFICYRLGWMILLCVFMLALVLDCAWAAMLVDFFNAHIYLLFVLAIPISLPLWSMREERIYWKELKAQEKLKQNRLHFLILFSEIYRYTIVVICLIILIKMK